MHIVLLIIMGLPQDYMNMILNHEYEQALTYCQNMITLGKDDYAWTLEQGDIYLDKIYDYEKAITMYQQLLNDKPKDEGWLHYRLALALEWNKDFLGAAKSYEIVATQFRKAPLDSFALSGVERCFRKNYQEYVAIVNGQPITRLELDEYMSGLSPFAKQDPRVVLDQLILQILIRQSAIEHEVSKTDLFKEHMYDDQRRQLLEEVYASQVMAEATPSEKQMKKYYKKNKENYLVKEQIRGKEIIVDNDSLARFLYDSLLVDIASFDTLARLYSTSGTKNSGGFMGIVYKGVRPEPIDKALFTAEVNTVIGVIEHDSTYGIYTVTEHRPKRYREFNEVKGQIETNLKAENLKSVEEDFMKKLRKKAEYTIKEKAIVDTSALSMEEVVGVINGRDITKAMVYTRNEFQPHFGKMDLSNPEQFKELLNIMFEEEMKLEYAEQNKLFLHDGYIAKMHEAYNRNLENGLYHMVVIEAVSVDSTDIREYYDEHYKEFIIPESVVAKEIVVHDRALAIELRKELLMFPEHFDSLAKEYSKALSAGRGGLTGAIRRGVRPKVFEDIAFNIEIGAISDIFTTDDTTFNIVMIKERNPTQYQDFETVRPSIETNLLRQMQRMTADHFLEDLKSNAEVEILLKEPEETESPEGSEEIESHETDVHIAPEK